MIFLYTPEVRLSKSLSGIVIAAFQNCEAKHREIMMKIFGRYLIATSISVFTLISTNAHAGTIILKSDIWDNICKVEIKRGHNGSVSTYSNVSRGQTFSASDRICYRRSGNPSQCNSGLTMWNCTTRNISGTETISLR